MTFWARNCAQAATNKVQKFRRIDCTKPQLRLSTLNETALVRLPGISSAPDTKAADKSSREGCSHYVRTRRPYGRSSKRSDAKATQMAVVIEYGSMSASLHVRKMSAAILLNIKLKQTHTWHACMFGQRFGWFDRS